jgi:6-pyruvoyl-tetrahydropterin synthase
MSTSTLFLNKITVIDHALINREGLVQGGSYNLSVKVSGEVKGEEQVVVDFSKLKSSIKNLIDDTEKGYDHKLWFIRGYSDGDVVISSEGGVD